MTPLIIVGVVLLILAGSLLSPQKPGEAEGGGSAPPPLSLPDDNVPEPSGPIGPNMISNDPATWPSSDTIWMVCCAIASAEGAQHAGSFADRNNNPGNISDGQPQFPAIVNTVDGEKATVFPDKATGWQWLYNKVSNIQSGRSTAYSSDWTWLQIGAKWATPKNSNWAYNVCAFLGVDVTSKFSDFTG